MKKLAFGFLLLTLLVVGCFSYLFSGDSLPNVMTSLPYENSHSSSSGVLKAEAFVFTEMNQSKKTRNVALTSELKGAPSLKLNHVAIKAFRTSWLEGDSRAPPVGDYTERELPTEKELANPELYLKYENGRREKHLLAFVNAAKGKVNYLRNELTAAKTQGMPQWQLEEGEEKLKMLEETAQEIRQSNPELLFGK